MKIRVLSLILCLSSIAMLGAQQPAGDTDEELNKKIKLLLNQIEELRRKQDPLLEEQARRLRDKQDKERAVLLEAQRKELARNQKEEAEKKAKEDAEKKKHFAKVEVRGKLVHGNIGYLPAWQVVINDMTWTLNFGDKKELLALAKQHIDKGVVITGTVVNVKANPYGYQPYPGVMYPVPPNPQPFPVPNPNPQPPWPYPYYGVYPSESRITLNVESLKLAND